MASALVASGSNVNVHGANVTLSAQSTTSSPASASPEEVAGQSVGVGASVAINVPSVGALAAVAEQRDADRGRCADALGHGEPHSDDYVARRRGRRHRHGRSAQPGDPVRRHPAAIDTGPALTLSGGLNVTANRTTAITTQVDSASAASGVAVGAFGRR